MSNDAQPSYKMMPMRLPVQEVRAAMSRVPAAKGKNSYEAFFQAVYTQVWASRVADTPARRTEDQTSIERRKNYNHYFRDVAHLTNIDIYRVLDLWKVSDPCFQHALKKILVAGGRGTKAEMGQTVKKDIAEAIVTLQRWQQMQEENDGAGTTDNQA